MKFFIRFLIKKKAPSQCEGASVIKWVYWSISLPSRIHIATLPHIIAVLEVDNMFGCVLH